MSSLVVAVGGGTASGKTTIAARAGVALGAPVLAMDRYYLDAPDPAAHDFDRPEALDLDRLGRDLRQLAAGEPTEVPVYDFRAHRRAGEGEWVSPGRWLVVEGILALAVPEVTAIADLAVFVDAAADVRLARRLRRDIAERGRTWDSVLDRYFGTVRANHERFVQPGKERAAVVLDGEGALDAQVERLVRAARALPPA